jgi:peptide/nickel transport system substrate-binding protein
VEATPTPEKVETSGPVVILIAEEIVTLEPFRMVQIHPEGSLSSHVWDTLTFINDDLEVEPHLATSWRLINNFTWELTLRPGIVFHNGEPVNADAVRYSIERAQSLPDSLETFAEDISLERVEVVDEYTLRLVTGDPVANLPYHLSSIEILPPVYYSETNPDQLGQAPVGSGPYQVTEWMPGEKVVLEAVPAYWKGAPTHSSVVFQTVPDADDRLQALRDGEATLITHLPPLRPDEWDIANSRLEAIESTKRMFVGIHVDQDSPLADESVRQALNYAVDVTQITKDWLKEYGKRYGSWVNPPGDNVQLTPWDYDPARTKALLEEAGYPDGFATTLHTPKGVYAQDVAIAHAIAEQLGQVGITVQVESVDWDTYVGQLLSDTPPPLFFLGMNSRGEAMEDVKNLSVDFPFNPTGWQNESFEDTVQRAQYSFNEDARTRLLNEAQAIGYDQAPWIWLWRQYDFYGVSQELDWAPRPDGLVYMYSAQAQPTEAQD